MRIWILGSGTLIPHPHRGSPGHWVETPKARVLLDCGSGTLRTLARLGLDWAGITHVVVSHFHTDHVGGLAPLFFALKNGLPSPRHEPLTLLGPEGLSGHLEALALAHGRQIIDPGFPLLVYELPVGGRWHDPLQGLTVRSVATPHTPESIGIRLESGGACVGYTGDTGPSPDLAGFFRSCKVLIAECSHADGWEGTTHLTPSTLASLAREAGTELLVPVHAYPGLDPESLPTLLLEAGFRGRVVPGRDGLGITVDGDEAKVLDSRGF